MAFISVNNCWLGLTDGSVAMLNWSLLSGVLTVIQAFPFIEIASCPSISNLRYPLDISAPEFGPFSHSKGVIGGSFKTTLMTIAVSFSPSLALYELGIANKRDLVSGSTMINISLG